MPIPVLASANDQCCEVIYFAEMYPQRMCIFNILLQAGINTTHIKV